MLVVMFFLLDMVKDTGFLGRISWVLSVKVIKTSYSYSYMYIFLFPDGKGCKGFQLLFWNMGFVGDFPHPSTSRRAGKTLRARTSGHRSVEPVRLQPFGKSWACDSRRDGRGMVVDGWMDGGEGLRRVLPPRTQRVFCFWDLWDFFFLDFLWIFLGFLMGFGGDGDGGEGLGCLTPPEN